MWKGLIKLLFPSSRLQRSKTVRYAFPLIALTAVFAGLATVVSENKSFITIETTPSTVKEGETFYIEVLATAHTPVNAIDITVAFPEEQISVEGIDTGTSVISLWTEEPYAKNGLIYLRGGTFQRGFLGEHTIARIRAKALTSGMAQVATNDATFIAGDGKGTVITVSDMNEDTTEVAITNLDGKIVGRAEVAIVTDIDGDGTVDLQDISAFMAAWFTRGRTFDFNGDGRMTFKDFSILLADSFFK